MKRLCLLVLTLVTAFAQGAAAERPVTVFAAASLSGVIQEIAQDYPQPVVFSFGGSGAMARQVAARAPADLVVLANPIWITWLEGQGIVARDTATVVARNALVVIGPKGAHRLEDGAAIAEALGTGRLAMGHRDAVPAGNYARQWLQQIGQWEALSQRLAETDNVRAALALVARGDAPLGIVYASDALAEPAVDVLYAVPSRFHDPIQYPAVALTPKGADFLTHLSTPMAASIFARHGFRKAPE